MNSVIIIGGGAAGMMAAISCAQSGGKVTLVERNEKVGKKIYITGKGRCNVTNHCQVEEFLKAVPRNGRFLYSALYGFTPEDTMAFFESHGCLLKVERGNRVFPVSEKASDVTKALKREMEHLKVEVCLDLRAEELLLEDGQLKGIKTQEGLEVHGDKVIIATGGKSYPVTGSTGDGYTLAKQVGHQVFPALPGLVPLTTGEKWPLTLQGLALKNVKVIGLKKGKKKFEELGEMLFTHFGFSGPLILELSSYIQGENLKDWAFHIDLKPGLSLEQVRARLLRDFETNPNKQIITILQGLMPQRLAEAFAALVGIPAEKPVNQVTKGEREAIRQGLKELPLPISGFRGLEEAIVTRGGVSVNEINPSTMESKKCKGLYFAGEVMDVDGYTGGYNLQIAFSTGALAGREAALAEEKNDLSK